MLLGIATAHGASHKLRVSDPAMAKRLIAQGGILIADYGGFQLIETSQAIPKDASIQPERDSNLIRLHAKFLDTSTPEVRSMHKPAGPFAGKRLRLIQFAGPVKPDWLAQLNQRGVQVVTYIPQNAYLVYGDAAAVSSLESWAVSAKFVQWEGAYTGDLKIIPRARRKAGAGQSAAPATDLYAVQLVADTNANPGTLKLIDGVMLEPVQRQFRALDYLNLIVRLPASQLALIAAQPDVVSIQPYETRRKLDERQDVIVSGLVSEGAPLGPGYLSWLASKGFTQSQFTASGFVVDVSDSGVDNGTTSPGHFGLYVSGAPSQSSRVVYNRLEGTANWGSTLHGCDGHGNLNAHIIAGYSAFTGFPFGDSGGYAYGLGVCPFVKIGSSVIFDPDSFTNPNYDNLQSDAYNSGARISANSWGAPTSGQYDADAQWYDALVRDAQPAGSTHAASGNQQMIIVFAAGNDGPYAGSVGSPGTAKNVITVGAAENVRSLDSTNGGEDITGDDGCSTPDTDADSTEDIADFSGRGPCTDGRQKPDLVAPGTHVTGGVPQSGAASTNGLGSADSCFDGNGICGLPGSGYLGSQYNFFPLDQQWYSVSSGTSHSTPAVAGACALLRQYFINHSLPAPSPAMTKAYLLNACRYLTGVDAKDSLWSPNQGMGELDLGAALDGVPRILHDQESVNVFTNTGATRTFTGTIPDPTKPFRVTLAWTDAPGSTAGNAFNNDLDLSVTIGGHTYKGNVFSGAHSALGGSYDPANNVESVFLPPGQPGNFVVTVTAANINSDGIPNQAPSLDQDFALVVYNAVETPLPVLSLEGIELLSENCEPTNDAVDPGETVRVSFALRNAGAAPTTNLMVSLLPTNGVAWPDGPVNFGVLVPGGQSVTQSFTFTALGACGGSIEPTLRLLDGNFDFGYIAETLPLGDQTVLNHQATNSTLLAVPGSGTVGPASPFPSTITVSGITGNITKVTLTLFGITHTYLADIDVLLVGPGGKVLVMSDCGSGTSVNDVSLTFDDDAADSLPASGSVFSGTYQPTDYGTGADTFSSPAPVGPYDAHLSAFAGASPNGNWSLYVQDDASIDSGSIQGWSLNLSTSNSICCTGAPPPQPFIQSIVASNSTVTVTWTTIPGDTYRLESSPDVTSTNWATAAPDVVATNLTTDATVSSNTPPSFYRVVGKP
jgi:subtilisin-like proprotein convertase family protein